MSSAITRLALLQVVAILYSILFVGFMVKARYGSPAPPLFATHLRDYGAFLLLLPTAWCIWGAIYSNRPRAGAGDGGHVFLSGVILFAFLVFLAFAGTMSAMTHNTIIQVQRAPQTQPAVPSAP